MSIIDVQTWDFHRCQCGHGSLAHEYKGGQSSECWECGLDDEGYSECMELSPRHPTSSPASVQGVRPP